MTETLDRISQLPNVPAVYALYGGRSSKSLHVAYVGVADKLKRRIEHHLKQRSSSVTTGVSVVSINPELVTEVRWWEDRGFNQRPWLEAAELIAADILNPVLRSRGGIQNEARNVAADPEFAATMHTLFSGPATGRLVLPTLQDALDRIATLEQRLDQLTQRLEKRS